MPAPVLDTLPTNVFLEKLCPSDEVEDDSADFFANMANRERRERDEDLETELGDTSHLIDLEESRDETRDHRPEIIYANACKKYGALPCSSLLRNLDEMTSVNLGYYNLSTKQLKALIYPIALNANITALNLQGNNVDPTGIYWISRLLGECETIIELNLAENNLGSKGAAAVSTLLKECQHLQVLNLADNKLSDNDAPVLAHVIETHPHLLKLDLSHNNFGELAAHEFQHLIGENGVLQEVNLSWNNFTERAAAYLVRGIKENVGLHKLDVSWNGFGDEVAITLSKSLGNSTLVNLDLSATRIGAEGFISLIKGLSSADHLKVLTLSRNPISEDAAIIGLEYIQTKMDELVLEKLELMEIIYGKAFKQKVTEVQEKFPNFEVLHGYSDLYGKRRIKQYDMVEEAMVAITKYCQKHRIKIVDLFARFDTDGSMSVSHEEFKIGLKEAKVPVTDEMINALIHEFDQDGDGEIDFSEMVMGAETKMSS